MALDEDYDCGLQQTVNLGHITTVKQVSLFCLNAQMRCPCVARPFFNKLLVVQVKNDDVWCHMFVLPLQGDEIAVECTYDTSDRTNVTIVRKYRYSLL